MSVESTLYEAASADLGKLSERRTRSIQDFTKPGPNNWTHETIYEFRDGERVTLEGSSIDGVVFPATPGFEYLTVVPDGDPQTFDIENKIKRMPVIGWQVRHYSCYSRIHPITPDYGGTTYSHWFYAVAMPDGRIKGKRPLLDTYTSLEAWIAAIREYWTAETQKKVEAEAPCPTCGKANSCDFDEDIPF